MCSALPKVCPVLSASHANDADVGVWIPVADYIPEEEVDDKLLELIEVFESKDLVNNGFKLFL